MLWRGLGWRVGLRVFHLCMMGAERGECSLSPASGLRTRSRSLCHFLQVFACFPPNTLGHLCQFQSYPAPPGPARRGSGAGRGGPIVRGIVGVTSAPAATSMVPAPR